MPLPGCKVLFGMNNTNINKQSVPERVSAVRAPVRSFFYTAVFL